MKNAITWFELPALDLPRAKKFYETVLNISLNDFSPNENLQMAVFPADEKGVGGALCHAPDFYQPSKQGALIYLPASNLDEALKKVPAQGGKVLKEKTLINDAIGYMALIEDCEGNQVGFIGE